MNPWLYPVVWMILIFIGSSQQMSGDESFPIFSDKIVHFIEFGILSFLFFYAMVRKAVFEKRWNVFLCAVFFTLLYSISDEVHQIYVPTRDASVFDLIADFCGAVCFALTAKHIFRNKYN
ncbi:VanZ family protein [bacterium]|nr:VanZ family protein [bacterium]MCP5462975.1 VanZ family protein [bacterium]